MEKASLQTTNQKTAEDPFLAEKRFGAYAMIEHLGKGGMGDVYKALQVGLDRIVALKILPSILARSSEFSERFFTEAYAISRLQHQNIVTIYDYGEEDGQKFIAMQYVQGTTLSKIIKDTKKLDYERIIFITKQICRGLKYAHQFEIVHRDIKSGNIMVEPGDKVYIADFGIAKVIDAPSITTTGMAMGTPEYMAPEQCEGGVVDGQSDIYGLGIIMYEMVTGRPPFLADTPLAVAYKQVHEAAPLLSKKCPDVPRRLELIVAKCLKKNKSDRYLNADELLRDLDSAHFEMVPEEEKELPPSDLRITDRRGQNRRNAAEPMALSRNYLWGILALFAVVLSSLAYVLMRPSEKPNFLSWQTPVMVEEAGEINFRFGQRMLITAIVVETGFGTGDEKIAGTNPNSNTLPKSLALEIEGRKSVKFALTESDGPQVFPISNVIVEKGKIRFGTGATALAGADNSVNTKLAPPKTIRFLGLPYP